MDQIIKKYLTSFEFGELQYFKNMGIVPFETLLNHEPEYMTLKKALDKNAIIQPF